jgi:predicted O-methyltransferase YrrM
MAYSHKFATYSRFTDASELDVKSHWAEFFRDVDFLQELLLRDATVRKISRSYCSGSSIMAPSIVGRVLTRLRFSVANLELYTLIRSIAPDLVLETGVASGVSSAIILTALSRNRRGALVSIDLPNRDPGGYRYADGTLDEVFTPEHLQSGWIVPQRLRSRWTLLIGKGIEVIPTITNRFHEIDFFFHDSEHSYGNMMSEFSITWPYIRPGGCLYVDDATWNDAFSRFAAEAKGSDSAVITPGLRGLLRKGRLEPTEPLEVKW